jgi:hypothetical protein
MPRPSRFQYPGAIHHVMARGDGGKEVFETDDDRRSFIHLNPARAGLAGGGRATLSGHKWSSLPSNLKGRKPDWLMLDRVFRHQLQNGQISKSKGSVRVNEH